MSIKSLKHTLMEETHISHGQALESVVDGIETPFLRSGPNTLNTEQALGLSCEKAHIIDVIDSIAEAIGVEKEQARSRLIACNEHAVRRCLFAIKMAQGKSLSGCERLSGVSGRYIVI